MGGNLMIRCLTSARFTMNAEILSQVGVTDPSQDIDDNTNQELETYQDRISGEILRRWVRGPQDNSQAPGQVVLDTLTIPCLARGIVDGGIRVAGSTERFGDVYDNIEFVKLWVPVHINIKKSDRITNIRSKTNGAVLWKDERDAPIVFNVNGVTPLFDAFNRPIEKYLLLEKADGSYGF